MNPLPPLTPAIVTVIVLAVVLGVLNQAVQQGKLLGQWDVPATWIPRLTLATTFLGGVYAFLESLPAPLVLTGSVVFYAVFVGGFGALTAWSMPGILMHHLGAAINRKRPAPTTPPPPSAGSRARS